ncbi:hypothetical protein [Mangrovivirga cuniculi]|nr:hypothetical protein [Mangrovivirga cuniculi]
MKIVFTWMELRFTDDGEAPVLHQKKKSTPITFLLMINGYY